MNNNGTKIINSRSRSRLTSVMGAALFVFFLVAGYDNPIYYIPAGVVLAPLVSYCTMSEFLGVAVVSLLALFFKKDASVDYLILSLFLLPALLSAVTVRITDGFKKSITVGGVSFAFVCLAWVMRATYSAYGVISADSAVKYLEERIANAIRSSAELLTQLGQQELATIFSDKELIASTSSFMAASLPAIFVALGLAISYIYVASCRKSAPSFGKSSNMPNSLTFTISKAGAIVFVLCQFFLASSSDNLAFHYTCISISIILIPALVYQGYGVALHMLHAKNKPGMHIVVAVIVTFLTIYSQFYFIFILAFTGAFDAVFDLRHLRRGKEDMGNG